MKHFMDISKKLKNLRKENGNKSQAEIASVLGITKSAYSNYEQGTRQPDYDTLIKIVKYFNTTLDYIFEIEKECNTKTEKTEEQQMQLDARSKENKVKQFTLTQDELEEIIANAIKRNELK